MTITREEIMGAVARGWCHPTNEAKAMDEQLALAIADEVTEALLLIGNLSSATLKGESDEV